MSDKDPASYRPKPMDTSHVKLTPTIDLVAERLAKNSHDVWALQRRQDGWAYGEATDDAKKLNCRLMAYEDLPENEKERDRENASQALKFVLAKGFSLKRRFPNKNARRTGR